MIAFAGALMLLGEQARDHLVRTENPLATTTVSASESRVGDGVLPYGEVAVQMGSRARIADLSLAVLSFSESRCPSDVECIQAGTVRITLETVSGLGTSTQTLALGEAISTEAERIIFVDAEPYPVSTTGVPEEAYMFRFKVESPLSGS